MGMPSKIHSSFGSMRLAGIRTDVRFGLDFPISHGFQLGSSKFACDRA